MASNLAKHDAPAETKSTRVITERDQLHAHNEPITNVVEVETTPGPSSPVTFFDLPREIRDSIYHHYWRTYPCIRTSFHGMLTDLRYEGYHSMTISRKRFGYPERMQGPYPTWLLANKVLFSEALSQFSRKAEWFWDGYTMQEMEIERKALMKTPTIRDITLYVGNVMYLDEYAATRFSSYQEKVKDACQEYAKAMQLHGSFKRLRLSSHSYDISLTDDGAGFKEIVTFLTNFFRDVTIDKIEWEVHNRAEPGTRVVYRVCASGSLELVETENLSWTEEEYRSYDKERARMRERQEMNVERRRRRQERCMNTKVSTETEA
ncbi:hypothetical protein BDV95DRAFT_601929 [Massariosphaeria phaeospora]|uniref:Uncharacterized protein n=1 Tax=Massariosphaeria phaeospora TaxID=100035 RepID=A0A7C8IER1_9PLEO|nr:hypothetical protein BDV95DRAFT_601929 [Massariosphaeria phaeospora]